MGIVAGAIGAVPTNVAPLPRLLGYAQGLGLERYLERPKRGVSTLAPDRAPWSVPTGRTPCPALSLPRVTFRGCWGCSAHELQIQAPRGTSG